MLVNRLSTCFEMIVLIYLLKIKHSFSDILLSVKNEPKYINHLSNLLDIIYVNVMIMINLINK